MNRSKLADTRSLLTAEDKLSLVTPTKATNTVAANTNQPASSNLLLSTPKPVEKP